MTCFRILPAKFSFLRYNSARYALSLDMALFQAAHFVGRVLLARILNMSPNPISLSLSADFCVTFTIYPVLQAIFELLSLTGYFLPSNAGIYRRSGAVTVSLAFPDGRTIWGQLAGPLVAAGPVQRRTSEINQSQEMSPSVSIADRRTAISRSRSPTTAPLLSHTITASQFRFILLCAVLNFLI
ncbi:DNA binding protein [Trifolium pratense]|uniref:AT-hook motif nuclear-localized protein n=1 Tax=Trifolium pratense TaxID=57577 RepID=A0A2K3NCT7_TRIPR|nr:DNA binding protein [Trifolium pratense]